MQILASSIPTGCVNFAGPFQDSISSIEVESGYLCFFYMYVYAFMVGGGHGIPFYCETEIFSCSFLPLATVIATVDQWSSRMANTSRICLAPRFKIVFLPIHAQVRPLVHFSSDGENLQFPSLFLGTEPPRQTAARTSHIPVEVSEFSSAELFCRLFIIPGFISFQGYPSRIFL